MSEQAQATLPAPDGGKAWKFAMAVSVFGKRAMDKVAAHEAAAVRAAAIGPKVVQAMITAGLIDPLQEKDAEAALGDHARTLEVLDKAVAKMAAAGVSIKTAAAKPSNGSNGDRLGRPVDPKTAGAYDGDVDDRPQNSPSPYVGQRAGLGEKRASDVAFLRGLGLQ